MTAPSADLSWNRAFECAKTVGYVPIAFSQTVRMLGNDYLLSAGQLRAVSKYQVVRVFRGPSLQSMLYFATSALAPEMLKEIKPLTVGDLITAYSPLDLASMICCYFLHRRARRTAGAELWKSINPYFQRESEIGAQVGVALPAIGFAPGLLIAALRNISHGLMSAPDPKTYATYRAHLIKSGLVADPAMETLLWGTTSAQVGSIILTNLGFRTDIGDALSTAVATNLAFNQIKDPLLQKFRMAYLWSNCFINDQCQPIEKMDGNFYPLALNKERASAQVAQIKGSARGWMCRDKEDLTAKGTPHLFLPAPKGGDLEIPDELKDVFSIKELTAMQEEDFDDLVDQIDAEQSDSKVRSDVIKKKDLQELESGLD